MLKFIVIAIGLLGIGLLAAGQAGLLPGKAPADLGLREGKLKAPSKSPNSVSSQAGLWPGHPQQQRATIAQLAFRAGDTDGNATMVRLVELLATAPGAKVEISRPDYVYATFTTRWLKFTDDVEFWLDPANKVIQVRSASRLGESDLGVNRARVEALRARLAP